jgi:thiosulfate/3-mercaptopyruvate sulfurtransferase
MRYDTLIDVEALRALLAQVVLLDCRFDLADPGAGRRAWLNGHITGARHADLNRDLSGPVTPDSGRHPLPSPDALAAFFAASGVGEHTQVVAYDAGNGSFAARAWWLLKWLGHSGVAVLDGGFAAWVDAGGAVESVEPARPLASAAHGFARPAAHSVATAADVQAALADAGRLLVDARAPERFAGTIEPLDPVAGHIPGAVNHPFGTNLGPDGRFLPAAELRRRWLERLSGQKPENLIAMCGSGVTACHNLLALAVAGLPGGRLYAGSWSEWIRDPARPVARGAA